VTPNLMNTSNVKIGLSRTSVERHMHVYEDPLLLACCRLSLPSEYEQITCILHLERRTTLTVLHTELLRAVTEVNKRQCSMLWVPL
jgi:hypothetical protein